MTTRRLPKIEAFAAPDGIDWDPPLAAKEKWRPVKAAHQDERTLAIADEIGDRGDGRGVTVNFVRGFLRRVGAGPVTVNINSTGGDFFAGLAIYNLLREHDGSVQTNVLGVAASAASLIAMASDELRVAKAGFLMIHNAWAIALGNRHDMRATADLLGQFDAAMAGVYADRSGIAQDKIAAFMDAETFFSGPQAVENGLADGLLASDEIEADDEPAPVAALRRLDMELARAGVPRSERRDLIDKIPGGTPGAASRNSGTPGAAAHTTPGAGDNPILAILRKGLAN